MSRISLPYQADEISALARSLRHQLSEMEATPSHVQVLNMLAKAIGYRNFQDFKAHAEPRSDADPASEPDPTIEVETQEPQADARTADRIQRLLRCFDEKGRLLRWPARRTDQVNALWVLWSRMPAHVEMTEREINDRLKAWNLFEDHAILRRELCSNKLMQRTPDGRIYRRIEQPVPPELSAAIRQLQLPA
jgi:hypothetical protein